MVANSYLTIKGVNLAPIIKKKITSLKPSNPAGQIAQTEQLQSTSLKLLIGLGHGSQLISLSTLYVQ